MADEPKKVLLVEDDTDTRRLLREVLLAEGHRVFEAENLANGRNLFQKERPDLVVLDLNLPDGLGFDILREIRAHKTLSSTPIIMLTGQGSLENKLTGLQTGADQYLVKPVHPMEFQQWVRALLRRMSLDKGEGDVLNADDVTIDFKAHLVHFGGKIIPDLTAKEFDLFAFLVRKRPQVLTRKYILSCLWHTVAVDHLVDTHVSNLRKKLPQALADRVQSISGKGFRYLA